MNLSNTLSNKKKYLQNKVLTKRFIILFVILLIGTHFLGLEPFAYYINKGNLTYFIQVLSLTPLAIYITKRYRNIYIKWLFLLWCFLLINKISSIYFRNIPLTNSIFQGVYVYDFLFFYLFYFLNPSIKQMERCIIYLGSAGLIIYFIQYCILPIPIVESISQGWRISGEYNKIDIQRFSITGEGIIYLCGLLSLNKYLLNRKITFLVICLLALSVSILHGYRSITIGYIFSFIFLYYKINGLKLNKNFIYVLFIFIIVMSFVLFSNLFNDVLQLYKDKNSRMANYTDIDRVKEFIYFYNSISKPWEWIFGAGFIGINFKKDLISHNWVDLGFIGMSFMGGIILTFIWIRLLLLNLRKIPTRYIYLSAFSIFIILSTITLNVAFADKCIVIQTLAFYLFHKVKRLNQICHLK